MSASGPWEFRPLRRSDFRSYRDVVVLGIGRLERSTGTAESAMAGIDLLERRSIRFVLGFLRWIGRPYVDVLVAANASGVAGTGTVLWLPKTAYVAGMATRPEYRGQGIASRILALQGDLARRRRRPWLALDVESDNQPAVRVYQRAGYRELGAFTWFTRTGSPASTPGDPPGIRPVGRSDWRPLTARLDASRPPEYRAAFPARPPLLHHNEILVRGGRMENETWWKETSSNGLAVLRAYFLPGTRMGALFPLSTDSEPSSEEFTGLFGAAAEWLRARDPRRCLAAAPEGQRGVSAALEALGFSAVVSSKLMVRSAAV